MDTLDVRLEVAQLIRVSALLGIWDSGACVHPDHAAAATLTHGGGLPRG